LEVEAVQLVASLLRVGYVFIDNEGGALGVVGDTLSNLAARDRQYKIRQAHLDSARQHYCHREGLSSEFQDLCIPNWAKFSEEVEQLFWSDVVTTGRNRLVGDRAHVDIAIPGIPQVLYEQSSVE
jgi:hypothetical protein